MLLCFVVEVLFHGIPEQKIVAKGQWIEHLSLFNRGIHVKHFIYSLNIEPWIWVGMKSISGISFAMVPFFSPAALNFTSGDKTQQCLFVMTLISYLMAFLCFGLQTASKKGVFSGKIIWHVDNVWGYHEDFHLILVIAHTLTSHMYDHMFADMHIPSNGIRFSLNKILERIESDYQEDYVAFLNDNFEALRMQFIKARKNGSISKLNLCVRARPFVRLRNAAPNHL